MLTELETLYTRLDKLRMTPAERELAKARLAQAEAFAAALAGAVSALGRLASHRGHSRGTRHSGLHPSA